jgi:hypothetical protein
MPQAIPDFTGAEHWCVETALKERYCREVNIEPVDVELRLDPVLPVMTTCPALYWKEGDAACLITKVGDNRFRSQFYYSVREQYGTGQSEYDDLAQCVVTLLQKQADHEASRQKNS